MHFQTGPSDLSKSVRPDEAAAPATRGTRDHHETAQNATRRLAQFYLAHWPEDRLAAILPTLRRYAVIGPEET